MSRSGFLGIALLWALSAFAQFRDLATTDDGSRVYFSSSLRQRGTDEYLHPKIFMMDAGGVHLVAQRVREGVGFTNAYRLDSPDVSGDGSLVAYTATRDCTGGSSCFLNEQSSGVLLRGATGEEKSYGGHIRISRNGRYVVTYSSSNVLAFFASRIDLTTGESVDLVKAVGRFSTPPSVASDGTVLANSGGLALYKTEKQVLKTGPFAAAVLDDAVTTVIYEAHKPRRRLFVIDLASRREWQLGPDDRDSFAPVLSNDGAWVLYTSTIGETPQLFFSRRDGTDWRQLTVSDDGVKEATLSGDGRVAYAVTGAGALLRIDTGSGEVHQIIAPVPQVTEISGSISPGSANVVVGTSLAPSSAWASPPLPSDLAGVEVRLAGRPVLLQYVSPAVLVYQIPWDMPVESSDTALLLNIGDPAFDSAFPVSLTAWSPQAAPLAPADVSGFVPVAIHQDFQSLVTNAAPATPGEIIHLYCTGFGPVTPPVPSGVPAPLDRLSILTTPWDFRFADQTGERAAEVLFAGLAPGLIGFYQVDARLPQDLSGSMAFLSAQITTNTSYSYTFTAIPIQPAAPAPVLLSPNSRKAGASYGSRTY